MLEAMKEQIGHSLDLSLHAFHYILKHAKKKKQRKVVLGVAVTLFYGDTQQQQQPQHHQQQQHRYGETRNPRRWRRCSSYSAQVPARPQQAQVQTVWQCRSFKVPL